MLFVPAIPELNCPVTLTKIGAAWPPTASKLAAASAANFIRIIAAAPKAEPLRHLVESLTNQQ